MPEASRIPSPWRSFRRFLLCGLIAFTLIALLWLRWHSNAAGPINARLAQYRARGEATTANELNPPAPPGADNAYQHLAAAAKLISNESPAHLTMDEHVLVFSYTRQSLVDFPRSAAEITTAQGMLTVRPEIPANLERLQAASVIMWPRPTHPPFSSTNARLGDVRRLALYQRIAALYHHHRREDALAISDIRGMNAISATTAGGWLITNQLLAMDTQACLARTAYQIAPDLQIQSAATPSGAPREEVRAIITALLDDRAVNHSFRRCVMSERVLDLEDLDSIAANTTLLLPIAQTDIVQDLDGCDTILAALGADSSRCREIYGRLPSELPFPEHMSRRSDWYDIDFAPYHAVKGAVLVHFEAIMYRHAAALRLAIRLYEIDHQDRIPPDLAMLLPAYLPALPDDPFRADEQPLVYSPKRRRFYSIGPDTRDDGGAFGHISHIARIESDCVFPLDRNPPIDSR